MTDDDYVRLRDLIRSTADDSGWASSLPGGASGRLIPADQRAGLNPGIVLVVPKPDPQGRGRFVLVSRLDLSMPIKLWGPEFYMTTSVANPAFDRSLRVLHGRGGPCSYADARQAARHADVCIANGQQPLPEGPKYRRLWGSLRNIPDPVRAMLLRPSPGQHWWRLDPEDALELLSRICPAPILEPSILTHVLVMRSSEAALDTAAIVTGLNLRGHLDWSNHYLQGESFLMGHACPSGRACRETCDCLAAAAARYLSETGQDPVARVASTATRAFGAPIDVAVLSALQPLMGDVASAATRYHPQRPIMTADEAEARFAVAMAQYVFTNELQPLRRPLAAFTRSKTDADRHAAAGRLQAVIQCEVDGGRLAPNVLQEALDLWSVAASAPHIQVTLNASEAA